MGSTTANHDAEAAYKLCLRLAIRAFGGLMPRRCYTKQDLDFLAALIGAVPGIGQRAMQWGDDVRTRALVRAFRNRFQERYLWLLTDTAFRATASFALKPFSADYITSIGWNKQPHEARTEYLRMTTG
jgi:hypothetical protein